MLATQDNFIVRPGIKKLYVSELNSLMLCDFLTLLYPDLLETCVVSVVNEDCLIAGAARLARVAAVLAKVVDQAEHDLIFNAVVCNPIALYNVGLYIGIQYVKPSRNTYGDDGLAGEGKPIQTQIYHGYALAI